MADKISFYGLQAKAIALLALFAFGAFSFTASAQSSSPYSRYGLGYIRPTVISANKGMGEVAAPYASSMFINFANPASYASINRSAIELGVNLDGANMVAKDSTYHALTGNVNHLAFAFSPKPDVWGLSLGLVPYSNTNFTFIQDVTDSVNGNHRLVQGGSGSLYQAYLGGAYKIKGFSIGLNLCYLFGKMSYEKSISFPDTAFAFNTRYVSDMGVSSFNYNVGLQYQYRIFHNPDAADARTDIYVTLGAYGNGGVKMNANVTNRWERFVVTSAGLTAIDTPQISASVKSKLSLPWNFGAGAMFGNELYWMVGADFRYANWSSFTSPLNSDPLGDSWRFNVGAQITPKYDDVKNYMARIQYRLGGYYGKSEVLVNGKNLSDAGGTLGLGFPLKTMRLFRGSLNLTGNFGSRTSTDASAIKENYYRVTFGFVLNDYDWFVKRKFD